MCCARYAQEDERQETSSKVVMHLGMQPIFIEQDHTNDEIRSHVATEVEWFQKTEALVLDVRVRLTSNLCVRTSP